MPAIPCLDDQPGFPDVSLALSDPNGLLACGGDLSPDRLLSAYRHGIFPWFNPHEPILWWSPDPRMVLFPKRMRVARSLLKRLKRSDYAVYVDRDFPAVIHACATAHRPAQDGTWITRHMIDAYTRLHELGWVHSFETWMGGRLVGGGYGVLIGCMFYGESMFAHVSDASKLAFVHWVRFIERLGVGCIDCQMETDHLSRFGSEFISRDEFLSTVKALLPKRLFLELWTDCIHEPT